MSTKIYSQDYIKSCFNAWYLAGRPSSPYAIKKVLPPLPDGKVPSTPTINRWIVDGFWDLRADELDAEVYKKDDKLLINKKAQILRKQQESTERVVLKARDHILLDGFDSSSAAVQAYYKGNEEIRKVAGFSDLLEKLEKMTSNDVEREIIALLNRAADNDQIIESEAEEIEGGEEQEESQG